MVEIVKTYAQELPALRFIGKKYTEKDSTNGNFGAKWGLWFEKGWFDIIEKQKNGFISEVYEDGDAYIGLMRYKEGEPFEYCIGIFMPEGTEVPECFDYVDFPVSKLGVCWLKGPEYEIYAKEDISNKAFSDAGFVQIPDKDGAFWFFERYGCPRFTSPDKDGNVILDICKFIA